MKKKVLVDLSITCEPPSHIGRYAKTLEDKAKQLEDWCKDFEWFMRDHRSQDPVSLNVERQYEEQCSYCGSAWEVDEEGPGCCHQATIEWDQDKACSKIQLKSNSVF